MDRAQSTIRRIRNAIKDGNLKKKFTGMDLVKIGIRPGTAWTFLWKHRKGTTQSVREYFIKNSVGQYSLIDDDS